MKPTPSPFLNRFLHEATRLTQSGRLGEATAAIQRALGKLPIGPLRPGGPLDAGFSAEARPRTTTDTVVLDGHVREIASGPSMARTADVGTQKVTTRPGRFEGGSFTSEFGTRAYKLYVPGGQAVSGARPLVVMLHGCTQDPDDFAAGTRMNELAEEDGFVVLYPAQAPRSNSSKCWNWFQPGDQKRGRGEPALLAAMTRHIVAEQAIDPGRVYVAGLSAGGAMAAILGQQYDDVFAAVGVHSGLAPGAAHDVPSAFSAMRNGRSRSTAAGGAPVIVFHGDHDKTVHPSNGEQVVGALAPQSPAGGDGPVAGAEASGADGRSNGRSFKRYLYRGADGRVRAELWRIQGAGHAWSGGNPAGSYTDATGPDASVEMLRFFREHARSVAAVRTKADAVK